MKCLTNKEINKIFKGENYPYRRRGRCKNCNGKCCNFVTIPVPQSSSLRTYWEGHSAIIYKDKWLKTEGAVLPVNCKHNASCGKCVLFGKKRFPKVCAQFPGTPQEGIWRYLMQTGNPCGFYFIDIRTGKKWNMRNKNYWMKKKKK